jgi:hypothetical protein
VSERLSRRSARKSSTGQRSPEAGSSPGLGWRGRARTSNIRLQRPAFCRLNYPPGRLTFRQGRWQTKARGSYPAAQRNDMGSLIKKRRKRMRKKKHKKMLKATRWQRRAAGK